MLQYDEFHVFEMYTVHRLHAQIEHYALNLNVIDKSTSFEQFARCQFFVIEA